MTSSLEVTVFSKHGGSLTKRISLNPDGTVISDGSACVMSRGRAWRLKLSCAQQLADLIASLTSSEAITLGALREDLPDKVQVVSKHRLRGGSGVIARTEDFICFRPGAPAFISVLPALKNVARVTRRSTSAVLSRSDTGERIPGSDGIHAYVLLKDGSDGERFLKVL